MLDLSARLGYSTILHPARGRVWKEVGLKPIRCRPASTRNQVFKRNVVFLRKSVLFGDDRLSPTRKMRGTVELGKAAH